MFDKNPTHQDTVDAKEIADAAIAVFAPLGEAPQSQIEYLVSQVQGLIDEVTDLVIPHATPDQGRAVLQAISLRVKILADRLDARAIRSQAFKL